MPTTIFTPQMLRNGTRAVPEIPAGGGGGFPNTYSLEFDGVDDYVGLGNPTDLQITGAFSFSCWINTTSTNYEGIYFKGNSVSLSDIYIRRQNNGTVRFFINNVSKNVTSSTTVNDGNWHHIMCVYVPSTSMTIYIDGSQDAQNTTTIPASINNNYGNITIGSGGGQFFNGKIDEASIFNTDQSANIATLSTSPVVDITSLSPIAWYRNGDNGSWKSPQFLLPSNENKDKVSNYSFEFDGVDDRVDTPSIDLGLENTISFWAKRNGTNFDGMVWGGTSQSNYYTVFLSSTNNLLYRVGGGANTFNDSDIISAVGGNDWFHCALVRNNSGADVLCYINGVLKQTKTSIVGSGNNTIVENIGSRGSTPLDFEITGFLDEMSLFNSALSASQILDIYNSGEPTTISGAVAHYKMGEDANFTSNWLVDNSALSNYSKRSFKFDGVDDEVNCGNDSSLQNPNFTVSVWVYPTSTSGTNVIVQNTSGTFGTASNGFRIVRSFSNYIFYIGDGSGNNAVLMAGAASLNTWQNIVMTYDGTTAKYYLDGVLQTTASVSNISYGVSPYNNFYIGTKGGSQRFTGNIDELSLYDTALSQIDITSIYNGGEPTTISGAVAHWRMGEDASFNGTNWTIPDNVGTNAGTSANMTVDDLVGEAPNYTSGGISIGMTIEDRVGTAPSSSNNALSFNMVREDRVEDVPS